MPRRRSEELPPRNSSASRETNSDEALHEINAINRVETRTPSNELNSSNNFAHSSDNKITYGTTLRVIQPYTAQNDEEMSIEIGDILVACEPPIPTSSTNYFLYAENHSWGPSNGLTGFIPHVCVEIERWDGTSQQGIPLVIKEQSGSEKNEDEDEDECGEMGTSTFPTEELSRVEVGSEVICIYPFEPTKSDELRLEKNDIVVVLECPEGGWWRGCKDLGQKIPKNGWFPNTVVKKFENENDLDKCPPSSPSKKQSFFKRFIKSKKSFRSRALSAPNPVPIIKSSAEKKIIPVITKISNAFSPGSESESISVSNVGKSKDKLSAQIINAKYATEPQNNTKKSNVISSLHDLPDNIQNTRNRSVSNQVLSTLDLPENLKKINDIMESKDALLHLAESMSNLRKKSSKSNAEIGDIPTIINTINVQSGSGWSSKTEGLLGSSTKINSNVSTNSADSNPPVSVNGILGAKEGIFCKSPALINSPKTEQPQRTIPILSINSPETSFHLDDKAHDSSRNSREINKADRTAADLHSSEDKTPVDQVIQKFNSEEFFLPESQKASNRLSFSPSTTTSTPTQSPNTSPNSTLDRVKIGRRRENSVERVRRDSILSRMFSTDEGSPSSPSSGKTLIDAYSTHWKEDSSSPFSLITKDQWKDRIPKDTLSKMSAAEMKRQTAIWELIITEKDYVKDLAMIIDLFLKPLSEKKVLSIKLIEAIFHNIQDIHCVNRDLLKKIEERVWENAVINKIGDVFNNAEKFMAYTFYCSNQAAALKQLQSLISSKNSFRQFLEEVRKNPATRGMDLGSYLIKPVQRICKYPLLLREILKHTPETLEDHTVLKVALEKIQATINLVNEGARNNDGGSRRITDIQNSFTEKLNFVTPNRFLVREDAMQLWIGNSKKERRLILFNDLIIIARRDWRDKYHLIEKASFTLSRVCDVHDDYDDTLFEIEVGGDENFSTVNTYLFSCASKATKQLWLDSYINVSKILVKSKNASDLSSSISTALHTQVSDDDEDKHANLDKVEIGELKAKIQMLDAQNLELKMKVAQLTEDTQRMEREAIEHNSFKEILEKRNKIQLEDIGKLNLAITGIRMEMNGYKERDTNLSADGARAKQMESQIEELNKINLDNAQVISMKDNLLKQNNELIKDLENANKKSQAENERLLQLLDTTRKEKGDLSSLFEKLCKNSNIESKDDFQELIEKFNSISKELSSKSEQGIHEEQVKNAARYKAELDTREEIQMLRLRIASITENSTESIAQLNKKLADKASELEKKTEIIKEKDVKLGIAEIGLARQVNLSSESKNLLQEKLGLLTQKDEIIASLKEKLREKSDAEIYSIQDRDKIRAEIEKIKLESSNYKEKSEETILSLTKKLGEEQIQKAKLEASLKEKSTHMLLVQQESSLSLRKSESVVAELEEARKTLQERDEVVKKNTTLVEKIRKKSSEIESLKAELEGKTRKCDELTVSLSSSKSNENLLYNKIQELEGLLDEKEHIYQSLFLEKQRTDAFIVQKEEKIREISNLNSIANGKLEKLEKFKADAELELGLKKQSLSSLENTIASCKHSLKEKEESEKKLRSKNESLTSLYENEKAKFSNEIAKFKLSLSEMKTEQNNMKQFYDKIITEKDNVSVERLSIIQSMQNELTTISSLLESSGVEKGNLFKEYTNVNELLKVTQGELFDLKKKIDHVNDAKIKLEAEMVKYQVKCEELKTDLKKKNKEIKSKDEFIQLNQSNKGQLLLETKNIVQERDFRISEMSQIVEEKNQELSNLNNELEALRKTNSSFAETLKAEKKITSELEVSLKNLQEEYNKAMLSTDKISKDLSLCKHSSSNEIKVLENKICQLTDMKQKLEEQNNHLDKTLKALKVEFEENTFIIADKNNTIDQNMKTLADLNLTLSEKESALADLSSTTTKLTSKITLQNERMEDLENELATRNSRIEKLEEWKAKYTQQHLKSSEEYVQLKNRYVELQDEIKKNSSKALENENYLKRIVNERDLKISHLDEIVGTLSKKIDETKGKSLLDMEASFDKYTEKMDSLKQSIVQLNQELNAKGAEIKIKEVEINNLSQSLTFLNNEKLKSDEVIQNLTAAKEKEFQDISQELKKTMAEFNKSKEDSAQLILFKENEIKVLHAHLEESAEKLTKYLNIKKELKRSQTALVKITEEHRVAVDRLNELGPAEKRLGLVEADLEKAKNQLDDLISSHQIMQTQYLNIQSQYNESRADCISYKLKYEASEREVEILQENAKGISEKNAMLVALQNNEQDLKKQVSTLKQTTEHFTEVIKLRRNDALKLNSFLTKISRLSGLVESDDFFNTSDWEAIYPLLSETLLTNLLTVFNQICSERKQLKESLQATNLIKSSMEKELQNSLSTVSKLQAALFDSKKQHQKIQTDLEEECQELKTKLDEIFYMAKTYQSLKDDMETLRIDKKLLDKQYIELFERLEREKSIHEKEICSMVCENEELRKLQKLHTVREQDDSQEVYEITQKLEECKYEKSLLEYKISEVEGKILLTLDTNKKLERDLKNKEILIQKIKQELDDSRELILVLKRLNSERKVEDLGGQLYYDSITNDIIKRYRTPSTFSLPEMQSNKKLDMKLKGRNPKIPDIEGYIICNAKIPKIEESLDVRVIKIPEVEGALIPAQAKQLHRQFKKAQKDEVAEKAKVKKAIQQGNIEGSRIYAQNAIRKKNEALNMLRLASRVDAVASRVETAVTMRKLTSSMTGVVKGMDKAMKSMNLEQISLVMDKFEQQFEDLDVQTSYMESSIGQTTALSTPQDQVDELIQQVAVENGLELQMELPGAATSTLKTSAPTEKQHDELGERLAKLRNM